eukprot:2575205-Amphidinium_carterae.2
MLLAPARSGSVLHAVLLGVLLPPRLLVHMPPAMLALKLTAVIRDLSAVAGLRRVSYPMSMPP